MEVRASSLVASALTEERAAGLTRSRPPAAGARSPRRRLPVSRGRGRLAAPGFADDDPGHPPPSWEEFLAPMPLSDPLWRG